MYGFYRVVGDYRSIEAVGTYREPYGLYADVWVL